MYTRRVDEGDFEGTLVLEKLASVDKLDEFFDAVDSDAFEAVTKLLRMVDIDSGKSDRGADRAIRSVCDEYRG